MLIALYKTLRGGEWLKASLDSIYKHVDAIIFIHSQVVWGGGAYGNNCLQPIMEWNKEHSIPVIQYTGLFLTQDQQYETGFTIIKRLYGNVKLLLIDTDEIWEEPDIVKLKAALESKEAAAYCCRMHTYIKSPFYRIDPPETCRPVVGIDMSRAHGIFGPRGLSIQDKAYLDDIYMHHFTYVRESETDIRLKFYTSSIGDNVPSHPDWFKRIWSAIPNVENFHPSIGYEKSWQKIKEITINELPEAIRNHPLVTKEPQCPLIN
ncbi:MAG: hypothetical protein PHC54_05335 [Candidatus Omnitrophica bacterium]|nr:hypothetical protein [Candidatus Omnitrophota bacterium]MDD5592677.1 hypothetical protein [Candidatus Omnitrophota bacterium]